MNRRPKYFDKNNKQLRSGNTVVYQGKTYTVRRFDPSDWLIYFWNANDGRVSISSFDLQLKDNNYYFTNLEKEKK